MRLSNRNSTSCPTPAWKDDFQQFISSRMLLSKRAAFRKLKCRLDHYLECTNKRWWKKNDIGRSQTPTTGRNRPRPGDNSMLTLLKMSWPGHLDLRVPGVCLMDKNFRFHWLMTAITMHAYLRHGNSWRTDVLCNFWEWVLKRLRGHWSVDGKCSYNMSKPWGVGWRECMMGADESNMWSNEPITVG